MKLTSLNSLAHKPGVEVLFKGLDLKQLDMPAAQHVQRSCTCTVKE